MDALRSDPEDVHAARALGLIGDTRAVPVINRAPNSARYNGHVHLEALGRLATPEAVDYLVDHLDRYGAVEALFHTDSRRALPALRKHLRKLQNACKPYENDLATTRVCILRLSERDYRDGLLRLGEDLKESEHVRYDALDALCCYDVTPLIPRLLKLYRADTSDDIRLCCIRLLRNHPGEAITVAMADHALGMEKEPGAMIGYAVQDELLEALNNRLGTKLDSLDEMQKHLREQRMRPRPAL
jgi:hypothetical protein